MQTAPYRRSGKATLSSLRNVRIKRWRMPCASATGQEAIGGSLEWEFAGVNPHDGKICKLRESSQPPTNVSGTAPPSAVPYRSEERRVGKECRSRWLPNDEMKKKKTL